MDFGRLDEKISILTQTETANAFGEKVVSSTSASDIWANIENLKGKKGYEAETLLADKFIKITIRYLSTLTTDDLITYDSENYFITSIEEIPRKKGMIIYATTQSE